MPKGNCQFQATGGQYFSTLFFHLVLFSLVSLGFYFPWACVRLFKLKASHTIIHDKKTAFSGTGGQFFVLLLLNGLLTIITLGFYGPWALCRIFRWKADHTLVDGNPSGFTGTGGALFVLYALHLILLPLVTFGLYYLVGMYRFHAWKEEHTLYGGETTSFGAGLGEYIKICLLTWILNSITLSLFAPWSLCMLYRWQIDGLAVGGKGLVAHFPPVRTNWWAVLIPFLMGLLLFAAAGFFILEEIKFHIQAFSKGSLQETGVLKSKIVRKKPEAFPPSKAPEVVKKTEKPTPVAESGKIQPGPELASPQIIQPKKPQPDGKALEKEMQDLDRVIKEDAKNGDAFYNRAWLYASKGDLNRALEDYTEAIRINPKNADAYYNRGIVQVKMKKYDHAVRDFQKVVTLKPSFPDAYCNRGNTYYTLGKYNLAIQDYTAALKIDPKDGDFHFNRGLAYLAVEQKDQALSDFKKAFQLGQKQAEAYLK